MIRSKINELAWNNFPIINLWEFFKTSRASNSIVNGPIWPKFELVRDFMHDIVISKRVRIKKQPRNIGDIIFPIVSQWGLSVAMETSVLTQPALKTFCSLSPTPVMLHIKFDKDWPTGLSDIQIQKCKIFVPQGQITPK